MWAPSADAIRSILQQVGRNVPSLTTRTHSPCHATSCVQRKFTDLSGSTEAQGDLKSVVLHKLSIDAQKSTFPVAIGAKITGVDDATYSITGEAFSTVVLPHADSHTSQTLQADDVSLAYECKFLPCPHTAHTPTHRLRACQLLASSRATPPRSEDRAQTSVHDRLANRTLLCGTA